MYLTEKEINVNWQHLLGKGITADSGQTKIILIGLYRYHVWENCFIVSQDNCYWWWVSQLLSVRCTDFQLT